MTTAKYILRGHTPVPVDLMTWATWFEVASNRIVAQTDVGPVQVSTLFIGLDHQWGNGPPLLFETMIFGGEHDDYQRRYSSWTEAVDGHAVAVALVGARTPSRAYFPE